MEEGLTEFFASKTRDWYRRGITNLAERWLKTIELHGLYFQELFNFLSEKIQNEFMLKNITSDTVTYIVHNYIDLVAIIYF